ncbi:M55 family metallopeptidase [Candidatus Bipolaricaulota bacterium]|nr:M55 family metallopeptidase [Candidatus Bipolaricaulota bacterium]
MKVYMSVDMEGMAGVTHGDHVKLEGVEYETARKWMTAEANAAIEAVLEAGATEVVIADAHGHMRNILPDELHEEALLVRGSPRPLSMMEGLDETFDVAFFIGYHSMAGAPKGILAHTYSGRLVYNVRLNGISMGETGLNAAIAGHFGVPVALICGDDTLDAEVKALMPWTERVITKWAISPTAARNLSPKMAQKRIHAGAKQALARLSEMKPLTMEPPIRMELDFMRAASADRSADIPGVERIDGRTLAYEDTDILKINRVFRLMLNIG